MNFRGTSIGVGLAGMLVWVASACGSSSSGTAPGSSDGGAQDGGSSTNDWSCVGHVTLAAPAKSTLSWQVQPENVGTTAKLPNLAVQACAATDGPCASPVASANTDGTSGVATLSLPAGQNGFDGFWQTQPPGDVPNLYFASVPIRNDLQIDDRQSWSSSALTIALGSAGASWDQAKGIVGFQVHDCNSRYLHQDSAATGSASVLGAGVSVTIDSSDSGIIAGYFVSDTLSTTADRTDASGEGGFVNVPEGWVTLTAKIAASGETIGTAHVYSKAGAVSGAVLSPSP